MTGIVVANKLTNGVEGLKSLSWSLMKWGEKYLLIPWKSRTQSYLSLWYCRDMRREFRYIWYF